MRTKEKKRNKLSLLFGKMSNKVTKATGSPMAFITALTIVIIWAVTGPIFGFSDTWQLIINTGTTIVTFLMVFLIQNTQNRDSTALHLKIDEIIRALDSAQNSVIDLEDLEEEDLEQIHKRYKAL